MKYDPTKENGYTSNKIAYGTIEKLSIQGDLMYCVVRRESTLYINDIGVPSVKYGSLFGSESTPENEVSLAEVLIPSDIPPSIITSDFSIFIGKKVEVVISSSNTPVLVLLSRISSSIASRGIEREHIYDIRKKSKDGVLTEYGKTQLVKTGYSKERVDNVLKEKYQDIAAKDDILVYGNKKEWHSDIKNKDNTGKYNMENIINIDFVSGITKEDRKTKQCYIPILSIGGKI